MPALRAVAYYRKSNDDDGSSIEQQREWARAAAQKEGVEIVREFADQAKKGHQTASRTAFHEMLAFCQEQARRRAPVQAVVCWHTNRFSRADSIETNHYLHLFREAGVSRFLTAQKWIDFGRGEDRLVFGVTQEASDHKYVIDLAKATTRGRIAAAQAGRPAGGTRPLGYRVEYEEVVVQGVKRRVKRRIPKRLVLGPEREVETVRLIFRLYADTPMGLLLIAQELTRRGIPTSKGRPAWTTESVKHVLTNPTYLGRLTWNRRAVGTFAAVIDGQPVDRPADAGKARANPREQWIERDDRHEPIIDLVTFERCQQKLAARGGGRRKTRGTFVLTGLLRCAHCGRAMVGRTEGHGRRVYFCGGYYNCGSGMCHYNAVEADALADALLGKLRACWGDEFNIEAVRAELLRQYEGEAGEGGRQVESLKRRLRQLKGDLAEGIDRLRSIDRSLLARYQEGLKALQAEQDQLEAELRHAESAPRPAEALLAKVDRAVAKLQELSTAVAAKEPDRLRELLAEVVTKVEMWFSHETQGKRVRCKFARGLVWLREDVALIYEGVNTCTSVPSA
jgi:DNA invertase Pin-like site-specific DNA recombinase